MSKLLRPRKSAIPPNQVAKWAVGMGQHKPAEHTSANVKMLPLHLVLPDPNNARKYLITEEELIAGPKVTAFPFDEDAQLSFKKEIQAYYSDDPFASQKIEEYWSLVVLAASIESPDKLHHPVFVKPEGSQFRLVFGHRRRLAHLLLNAKFIFCRIGTENGTDLEHVLTQYKENKDRQDLDLKSEILAIKNIIQAWENETQESISIKKLTGLISAGSTKASWLLGVYRAFIKDDKFKLAIESGTIKSLEIAYKIASMQDNQAKTDLLDKLMLNNNYTFDELNKLIKAAPVQINNEVSTKLNFKKAKYGLNINKEVDPKVIARIIELALRNAELADYQTDFDKFNINKKKDLEKAWAYLYELILNKS